MTHSISVVVPVYNGAIYLNTLVDQLSQSLALLTKEFEVIFVNDNSPDNSWQIIESLAKQYPWVHGIHLMRNYGQHNATLCGVRSARYELTVTMDDDLQHSPEALPAMIAKLDEGYDVVYGAPQVLPQGFFRNQATRITKSLLARVMGVPSVKHISAYRVFRTGLRDAFANFQSPQVTLDVLLSWGTTQFSYVFVDIKGSPKGASNYNLRKLIRETLLILTGFSTMPLRAASLLGFFIGFLGLAVLIYVLVVYFTAGSIPGFPFLASIIAVFSGTQLMTLGIFGEYLARIFVRSMDRPTYVIQSKTDRTSK
jgi:undecaprenyl-phosphate 4-deoxy-4-formamido-L-arabinose transferase